MHTSNKAGKEGLRNHIISIFLTIAIVLVLVIPAKGVIIDLLSDKEIYQKEDIITFAVSVDIEDNERVPIQNLSLRISNSSVEAQLIKGCAFSLSGAKISGCDNILDITPLNTQGYGYGYSFGYGYGYGAPGGYGYANQSFGYGYGYGYSAGYTGLNGVLAYNITWNITADNVSDGNYTYDLWAYADDGNGNSRIYSDSSLLSFEYDKTVPAITIEEIIAANNTSPVLNITTSENANCSYKNSTEEFVAMETTGTMAHTHALSLYPGDFSYTIQCTDAAGNTANDSIIFTIISGTAVAVESSTISVNTTANQSQAFNTTSGLELTLLADISANATMVVSEFDSNPENTTSGFAAIALGKYFTITAADVIKDNLGWLYLKIYYNDSDVSSNNIDESTLRIYYYNSTLGRWAVETDSGVNTTANFVWANITHLSTFGAGGSAIAAVSSRSSGSGGGSRHSSVSPDPEEPVSPLPPAQPASHEEKPAEISEPIAVPDAGPLFDFGIKVLNHMKKVFAGNYLIVEFTSINVGDPGVVYAIIEYSITNSSGAAFVSERIDITVESEQSFVKQIYISEGLAPGKYKIKARLDYDSQFAEAEDYFEIVESQSELIALYIGLGILLLLLIVGGAYYYVRFGKKRRY